MNNETSSIIDQNEREYEGLIVSLEANQERLNILICVCDQEKLREEIIDRYSKELEPVIPCYRIDLDQKEPSLRAAIASLVSRKPELLQSKNAVITTTGVEKLHSIEWQQEKSELDKFFGYLQWTREGLREFPYSIVLWVTSTVEVNLRKKSPDFWSWRKGVFRFISPPSNFLPCQEILPILQSFDEITIDKDIPLISKEDLLELIEQIEVNKGKKEPRLASLYASLAKIYNLRLLNLPLSDYRQEQQLAIEYYQKAIDLQKELNLELDLVASLDSLAGIYYFLGEYQKVIEFDEQHLAITRKIGDRMGEAKSYNNLGNVYYCLGKYQKAIRFHKKSLAITREIGDRGRSKSPIAGVEGLVYRLAGCCCPLPGENITGIVAHAGEGIVIHRQGCSNVAKAEAERLIPVSWNPIDEQGSYPIYPVNIQIEVIDRVGVLRGILSCLSDQNINVRTAGVKTNFGKPALISLKIEVKDLQQLERCVSQIKLMRDVLNIRRISQVKSDRVLSTVLSNQTGNR
ncbi:tetratricopeptide repeat protein [Microcystis aeruginosa]|jgi:hypothetical protein|uniref:ACT domain-containing protein n=1 Tax=Microcystis aeruginosa PCC 9701 TaxID=721123 RepID=I4IVQ3_MICAE|nr:tetratricopeptide repeat protein [Microcystis aeruginosa]CCI38377.1 hypothetical protein MICAK_4090002 [Microcystis aeruginosa PCC 9701]